MSSQKTRALNWYIFLPVVGMLAFVVVMAAFFLYLHRTEAQQQKQQLYRDIEWAQQNLLLRWRANQDSVTVNAQSWTQLSDAGQAVRPQLQEFLQSNTDIVYLYWIDSRRMIQWLAPAPHTNQPTSRSFGKVIEDSALFIAFTDARERGVANYSPPFVNEFNDTLVELHVPVFADKAFLGTVAVGYSLSRALNLTLSESMLARYKVDLADYGGSVLVSTSSRTIHDANLSYELPLNPPGHGIRLRAFAFETRPMLLDRVLFATVFGLSFAVLAGLALLFYFARQRLAAEQALAEESGFRRAMEDSISTGMRVFDLEGKITYVNPAFCKMVGFEEEQLIGQKAPYPYWPIDQHELHHKNLQQLMAGLTPVSGLRTEVQRRDGSRFFARMYVSALVDQKGQQTGWMTSMTDITEPERIREQLRAAHEQFTTVMEQLDAAVCVLARSNQLVFSNHRFQQYFGTQTPAQILAVVAKSNQETENALPLHLKTGNWYEIRWRKIAWVDQSEVTLVLLSDVTLRQNAEAVQREQQERVERTSRLISMGEMASSLAHELNQPLTAISNYTVGGSARLQAAVQRGEPIPTADLTAMLEKTARQAERAGKVVRRIREFVKRSEPDRKLCNAITVAEDAIGLAEIDAARMQMHIKLTVQQREQFPPLYADPILIEQVLLNLIKNGMESMAKTNNRELHVTLSATKDQIQFSVLDRGTGVAQIDADKLFDPFFTTKSDGMGMGLNICRSIIEFHQGRLWFSPRSGGGSEFSLTLPFITQFEERQAHTSLQTL